MPDGLTPAARDDLLFAIDYALQFTQTGKVLRLVSREQAAGRVLEQLERSGFVIYRKPPLPMPGVGPHRR